jgi:lipoprotein NlpD
VKGAARCLARLAVVTALGALSACSTSVMAPVETRGPYPPGTSHTARAGDTLDAIAFQYGVDYRSLARWNRIEPPYRIYPGQQIRLAGGGESAVPRRPQREAVPAPPPAAAPEPRSPARAAARTTRADERVARSGVAPHGDRQVIAARPEGLRWAWPARGRLTRRFAQDGSKGLDIAAFVGAPVRAAAAGRVVYAGSGLVGYGKLIIVKHNDTYLSAYAHNDRLLVKEGESVVRGQQIAHMGRAGGQAARLHFEIRRDGKAVDPLTYLPGSVPPEEDTDA